MDQLFFQSLLCFNIFAYLVMCVDKLKSIYHWWRIPEKILWTIAILGGVFGIWLGMYWPMYHKAGKKIFRIGIPLIGAIWVIVILYILTLGKSI